MSKPPKRRMSAAALSRRARANREKAGMPAAVASMKGRTATPYPKAAKIVLDIRLLPCYLFTSGESPREFPGD